MPEFEPCVLELLGGPLNPIQDPTRQQLHRRHLAHGVSHKQYLECQHHYNQLGVLRGGQQEFHGARGKRSLPLDVEARGRAFAIPRLVPLFSPLQIRS
jgi:hypothetical protein